MADHLEEKRHSPLGASIAKRWTNCTASVGLIDHSKKAPGNIYSAEGTVAHAVAESRLLHAIDEEIFIFPGIEDAFEEDGFTIPVDVAMIQHAEEYAKYVVDLAERLGGEIMVEQPIHIPSDLTDELWGRCDSSIYAPYHCIAVIDYKYGAGTPVDVEDNEQALYYALGKYYSLPEDERRQLEKVILVIYQPRHPNGIQYIEYPIEKLLEFEEFLNRKVWEVKHDPKLVAGDHCKWCPAELVCPEKRQYLKTMSLNDWAEVKPDYGGYCKSARAGEEAPWDKQYPSLIHPLTLTNQQLSDIKKVKSTAMKWFDTCIAEAHQRALEGQNIPGFELVPSLGDRQWKPEAGKTLLDIFPGADVYEPVKLKSPAQMEKAIPRGFKEIEKLVFREEKGKALVKVKKGRIIKHDWEGVEPDA